MKRAILLVAVLFYAVGVAVSGAERTGLQSAFVERIVPLMWRANSLHKASDNALVTASPQVALDAASAAVQADPSDYRAVGRLAFSYTRLGDADRALAAFHASDRRGWRDSITQAALFERAIALGNFSDAASHADALLRTNPRERMAQATLQSLEAFAGGRLALRDQLRGNPAWSQIFWSPDDPDTLLRRATYLSADRPDGKEWGCTRTRPLVRALLKREWRAQAEAVYANQCRTRLSSETIADSAFTALAGGKTPLLGWRVHPSGDVSLRGVTGKETALKVTNRASTARQILSQPVDLTDGNYNVMLDDAKHFAATLSCGSVTAQRPQFDTASRTLAALSCRTQTLSIWVRGGVTDAPLNNLSIARAD